MSGLMVWASTATTLSPPEFDDDSVVHPIAWLGFDHREGPRRLTHRDGVDQDQRVVALEKVVREMNAPDPIVLDPDPLGEGPAGEQMGHLDAEGVVGEKDVPDARDENAAGHGRACPRLKPGIGSTSSGRK